MEPGTEIGWHRHTGEVHAINLTGQRALHSGEVIGPGDYVYEPQGNTDRWQAIGDDTLIVHVVVMGKVEYLNTDGSVLDRYDGHRLYESYRQYCLDQSIKPADLID